MEGVFLQYYMFENSPSFNPIDLPLTDLILPIFHVFLVSLYLNSKKRDGKREVLRGLERAQSGDI